MEALRILQLPFGILALIGVFSGMILLRIEMWRSSASMFLLAFICMFVVWTVEYRLWQKNRYEEEDE